MLKLLSIAPADGSLTLRWKGGVNVRQVVQRAAQLGGPWTNLYTNNPPAQITNTLALTATTAEAYFRVSAGP